MAVFYVAASLAGAFSGLLAYGIEKLDGRSGLAGWQWIFLIEGLIPVALALFIWKILPDSPETAKFLTQPERDLLVSRLSNDSGSGQGQATNSDTHWSFRLEDLGCYGYFLGKHRWSLWVSQRQRFVLPIHV
jgi:MFS family permease